MSKDTKEKEEIEEQENAQPEPKKVLNLDDSCEYWDFRENPIFEGRYKGEHYGKDKDDKEKLIGYIFEDLEGETWLIGNTHLVTKNINVDYGGEPIKNSKDGYFRFEFKGQTFKSDGLPFNKFKIDYIIP